MRINLRLAAVLLLFLMPAQAVIGERLPNIILLIGDDHGYPYFGFTGNTDVVTPAMDGLANGGVTFTQGHVTAPYCRPSLRTLMTGLHPVQYKNKSNTIKDARRDNDSQYASLNKQQQAMWDMVAEASTMKEFDTLPKLLGSKGYASWQGGKWWENSFKNGHFTHGMTTGWDMSLFGQDDFFHQMMGAEGNELGRTTMAPVFEFIEDQKDQPFFIWYGPMLPHTPLDAPYQHYKYYRDKDLSESAKLYYANISWWDAGVGQLMDYVEQQGLLENTLFIYVNDNGWEQEPQVEYWREGVTYENDADFANGGDKGKLGLYDQSFRTPIIFYWKGKLHHTFNRTSLVSSADIVPTVLDIVGIESGENLPGQSLKPLLEGNIIDERDELVGYVDQRRSQQDMMGERAEGYYVRTHRWHFLWYKNSGEMALFDISIDPKSEHNVIDKFPHLIDQFKEKIEAWKKTIGMDKPIKIS